MAYQRWWETIRDQQGNAVNGANCAVYNGGTGTLATVYDPNTDDSAPGSLSNPFVTGANGVFGFMAADGEYDVKVSGGAFATQQYRVTLNGFVSGSAASLQADLASTGTGKGAYMVGYLAPYTGASAETLQSRVDKLGNAGRPTKPSKGLLIGDSIVAAYSGQLGLDDFLLTASDVLAGSTIVNQAVPGDKISQQLADWTADANKATYDWIVIQVGINDVQTGESSSVTIASLQGLVDAINAGKKANATVVISAMLPISTFSAPLLTARADVNTAIMGGGATPITGVDYRVDKHTDILNDGYNGLGLQYDSGDGVHPLANGRAINAACMREALVAAGFFLATNPLQMSHAWNADSTGLLETSSKPIKVLHKKDATTSFVFENQHVSSYTFGSFKGTGRTYSVGVGNASETFYGVANRFFILDSTGSAVRFSIDSTGTAFVHNGFAALGNVMERAKAVTANGSATTFTYPANTRYQYISTSAASLAVTLPATSAALDGLVITFVTGSSVATATWVAGAGGATIVGGPASLTAFVPVRMIYHHPTLAWCPY